MTFELLLSYAALILLLVLMLIYFSKVEFKNARTTCYKILVWLELLFTTTDIAFVLVQKYFGSDLFDTIFCKIHWMSGIVIFVILEYYFSGIAHDIKSNKLIDVFKSTLVNKILGIFGIILVIAYACLPYTPRDMNNLRFIETVAGIAISVFFTIIAFIITIELKKNENNITKQDKVTSTFSIIFSLFTMVIQLTFKGVSFIPFGYLIILYEIYFNSEDPDIAISREINSAQTSIEQSNKTKTDFLSNMTFEIKTPMNLITSLCDDLRTMPTFDEATIREDIKQIQKSGNNLLDIINNILDISKIETGKDVAQEKSYKINDLITDVVNVAKTKIGAKPVKLMVNIDQNISSMLSGDSSKLYQSLTNVVNNAAKYTEVGRITLTITSTKNNNVETLLFKVSDTGPGIKDEDKDKLFKKFERLDNATENEVEGSGLGLVITKQYIDTLGGKIWFESQYRVGTTFYIELAQKIVDPTPIGKAIEESANKEITEKLDCSQYVALIVDDNALNIKVAKRLLETYKFKVESFQSGKECVQAVKDEKHYDVIFMDHMMPEMDGIETLHVLKKLDGYQIPPVVALTANAIAGMKEMYLSEGFDEYLSKPINTNELDRIVNKYFKK